MQQFYQCPNCSAPISYGVRFCSNCGAPVNWSAQKQTTGIYENGSQKRRLRSKIAGLSEISADFRGYIQGILAKGASIQKVDWMPCPRCGAKTTKIEQVRAPESGIGCVSLLLFIVNNLCASASTDTCNNDPSRYLGYSFCVGSSWNRCRVVYSPKKRGHKYSCAGCGFIWTGRDVELYLKESNSGCPKSPVKK